MSLELMLLELDLDLALDLDLDLVLVLFLLEIFLHHLHLNHQIKFLNDPDVRRFYKEDLMQYKNRINTSGSTKKDKLIACTYLQLVLATTTKQNSS